MNSTERHEARYQRRKEKRLQNKITRFESIGDFDKVFSVAKLYHYSKLICKGIRWKQSTQNFERHKLSKCIEIYHKLQKFKNQEKGAYKPGKYNHFVLYERGKKREIDAPLIQDKLVQKVYSREVLHPIYGPILENNNGASQKGKGTAFSRREIRKDLREHFHKYGKSGNIILLDFKDFFPSASHEVIKQRHKYLFFDDDIRRLADLYVDTAPGHQIGMPLGIEPSQYEMIAFSSALDHYITCQLHIKGFGRYMDDYYMLIPPDRDPKEILKLVVDKAKTLGLKASPNKTRIIPFGKPFRYCKVKYIITDTGKIITRVYSKNIHRSRRKVKSLIQKYQRGERKPQDVWNSIQSCCGYLAGFSNHGTLLRYRRLVFSLLGFDGTKIENWRFN